MIAVMDAAEVKERAVRAALELGAGAVRVTDASIAVEARRAMTAAFARNDLASWNYTAAYARAATDPRALLPGARSVICVAMPYAVPRVAQRSPLRGRVSNYAWSTDYHRELRSLLEHVAGVVDAAAGAPVTAVACDTRPLAERAFAARAGLGWIGKHTNVISPEHGSFVFLGEVVTTLKLPADVPLRKGCGQCARCVEACPTGALRGDYTIDANRCISDLTQRTGSIPRAMRALVGDWVWGCDLCQLVCPPTSAAPRAASRWAPRGDAGSPSLVALLALRSGEFDRRYRGTAMGWRGGAVLRRNAAVALGNELDRSAVPALCESLHDDPHPMVRGHVAWALGRIGSPAAQAALRARQRIEEDAGVREEIAAALGGSP
jgi:epoxyqueuosine reductase